MFNESFSIRALLALPQVHRPLAVYAEADSDAGTPGTPDTPGTPGTPGVFAYLPTMLRLNSVPASASAFSTCANETPGPVSLPAEAAAEPVADTGASAQGKTYRRRPTRAAQVLARIHDRPAGYRFTFVELNNMLPQGARTHSAVAKMLEFGFLVRLERGLYERTATLFFGDPMNRGTGAFAGLNLFTARCSSPSNRRR